MDFLKKIWVWLQGRKTAIGALLLLLIQQAWFLEFLPDGNVENSIVWILGVLGSVLTGVGIVGQVKKSVKGETYADLKKEVNLLKK